MPLGNEVFQAEGSMILEPLEQQVMRGGPGVTCEGQHKRP